MGKKSTKKRTQWRTLSITEQDDINSTNGTEFISNGRNNTTGLNIDEASSVDDNFKYSGTNFSYLKRKSSAFSPSSNSYFNINSNRNDHFRINSYNTNTSYYYNNKHNSSSINNNNNNNNNHNFIAINTTSNASSVNNDTTITTLYPNNIRYTRSLSSSSRYSSSYNNNNNNNSNNNINSNNRRKPYSMQNGGSSSSSSKYYSSYGAGRATSRTNRTSYSSYNRNNLNSTSSNNELSSLMSSSTTLANKENYEKPLFNEDEYTRITTPRQDVIFKKGYLSRPKPLHLSSTDTNTTSSATASIVSEESMSTATSVPSSLSPEQCSSIHSDSIVDPEQAFMYSYIDQNGILYVNPFVPPNGFDHYPGQMLIMPYGYPPYNLCPPDLNTPSTSDVDNETMEHDEFSADTIEKNPNETDKLPDEVKPVFKAEDSNIKETQFQEIEKNEIDTTESVSDNNKDKSDNSENESKDESINELTKDETDQNNKVFQPYMRNNCDPNFFNYGYGGPPMYPPIFYPISYYGGPPLMPFIGPPPYEMHSEMINEELVITEIEGEKDELKLNEKIQCKNNMTVTESKENQMDQTENEAISIEEPTEPIETFEKKLGETTILNAMPTAIKAEVQDSNEDVQSCDADDTKSSITQETEPKQQPNLNVNVDEFVPRVVIKKPHLNVNVKEFQPRNLQKSHNTISPISSVVSSNNENIELTTSRVVNSVINNNSDIQKDVKTEQITPVNVSVSKTELKNIGQNNIGQSRTSSTIASEKILKSSQKSIPTLAEQIKISLAVQNGEKPSTVKQPSKVFHNNSNNNMIKNVNGNNSNEEHKDLKSNFKAKDKITKSNSKLNSKSKFNRNIPNSNTSLDKNNNNANGNKNLNNDASQTSKNTSLLIEKDKNSEMLTNLQRLAHTPSATNVLSYAQMLNRDLLAAQDKENTKYTTSTKATNPANSSENELDDAEVQLLIKSLETAEKLTAMKENVCWQTVKSRGKRSKYYKEALKENFDSTKEVRILQVDAVTNENPIEVTSLPEVIVKYEEPELDITNNSNNIKDLNENTISMEVGIVDTVKEGTDSVNKGSEKKKSRQKNKKTAKKSPNAKKSSTKEVMQRNSESSNETNENPIKFESVLNKSEIKTNTEIEEIDDNTLALKLFEDLEKELDIKIKSNLEEEDEDETNDEMLMGNSPFNVSEMKHSTLGHNLDMLSGFDYKYKTKNILKEEEEMVLNVIKSLSSNSSSPIGCNKKSDNIFNASFIALNGGNSSSAALNNLETFKTNLSEDSKNLIRKSSCLANINISTPSCGKYKLENNERNLNITAPVDDVSSTVAETEQHEDSNDINTATVLSPLIKKEEANSEYIQNCIKESLKWIKKMESVEKSIDSLEEIKSSIDEKTLNSNKEEEELNLHSSKQCKADESAEINVTPTSNETDNCSDKLAVQNLIEAENGETQAESFELMENTKENIEGQEVLVKNEEESVNGFVKTVDENFVAELNSTSFLPDPNKNEELSRENNVEQIEDIEKSNNIEDHLLEIDEISEEKKVYDILEKTSENPELLNEEPELGSIDNEGEVVEKSKVKLKVCEEIEGITTETRKESLVQINEVNNIDKEILQNGVNKCNNNIPKHINATSHNNESEFSELKETDQQDILKLPETTTVVRSNDTLQDLSMNLDSKLENLINGACSISDGISNGFSEHDDQDSQLEKKLNGELLHKSNGKKKESKWIKDISKGAEDGLNGLVDFSTPTHLSKDIIICNRVNGIRLQNGSITDTLHDTVENQAIEEKIIPISKEINKAEVPLYNNNHTIQRERLSNSCSDSNEDNLFLNGLEKHKSTSSLALQLQQLEEQLRKLNRLATKPLVSDEHKNCFYNSENDLNSITSSETSTLEDSLTSPKSEILNDSGAICSSDNELNNDNTTTNIICNIIINNDESIVDAKSSIDIDLNSSNSSNRNSQDCDSLNITNSKHSEENCSSRMFPSQSQTNEFQFSVDAHDSQKFPLTLAVKQWLAQEITEKTPEPILRLPGDPNLHTRIKSSLSLHQSTDENDDKNFYLEDDCWSLTDGEEGDDSDEETEVEECGAEETETEQTKTLERVVALQEENNENKMSKNLKSNPLHVSSVKLNNHIRNSHFNHHQNDNDSDYNSDNQISNKFDNYDDNYTCERVAANTKLYKSDENNIITTSSELQQIDYFWDDFIENPSKYLQNSKRNTNTSNNNNNSNNLNRILLNHRINENNTSLDTTESMFSSGTSSMNELHDFTPYESVYGKSINYDRLLASNYELLSNKIISFNNNNNNSNDNNHNNNNSNNSNDNNTDDDVDDNLKKINLNREFHKNNSIAVNHNNNNNNYNKNDTLLNENINLNNDNINKSNNKDNCIKPPEVCCIC